MTKSVLTALCLSVVLVTLLLAGCPVKQAEMNPNAPARLRLGVGATGEEQAAPATGAEQGLPATGSAAKPAETAKMATCAVCGMSMAQGSMLKSEYKGQTYYFCSQSCLDSFKKTPDKFLKATKPAGAMTGEPKAAPAKTRPLKGPQPG